ncbi:MAG TPA: IS21 family transposase [Anaerolineae bacterium]|nr:IS21 family transposase [Anaerolineae bacterium]HUW10841.1 IS21 family transposase [Anaerolineae bacterium]
MEIRELLRYIQADRSDRAVNRATGMHRQTVKRYREWAAEQGLLECSLPPIEELQALLEATLPNAQPPQNVSSVELYRDIVTKLHKESVEMAAIHQRLKERGYTGSYSSVRRFVRNIDPRLPEATVRVERKPGEEGQVDFGYAGRMIDPESGMLRKTWAFVLTLSWSRHQYVEFVFDQKVGTWLMLHCHAFEFLSGAPERLVIDNLKAAMVRACWDDPEVQYAYRECAEHYGFLVSPCRPRTPRHKGKVEQGGVHYVKRNFLGGREPTTITQANRDVLRWVNTVAGLRIHGTTKEEPLLRFQEVERAQLKPLPETRYDLATWKTVTLHRDCHITFDKAYYSAPFRLIGQKLRVRGGARDVHIYSMEYHLIATHPRAQRPGERKTNLDHLPPEKVPGLIRTRDGVREAAAEIGTATSEVVTRLLDDPVIDRLHTAGRLVRLSERFGDERLEAASVRALHFGDPAYKTIKRILVHRLEGEALVELPPAPPARAFVRRAAELVGHLGGGVSWN